MNKVYIVIGVHGLDGDCTTYIDSVWTSKRKAEKQLKSVQERKRDYWAWEIQNYIVSK